MNARLPDPHSPMTPAGQSLASPPGCPLLDLRLADCMAVMREMPDNAYDLAIVDPPYGIGWDREHKTMKEASSARWKTPSKKDRYEAKEWDAERPSPATIAAIR